jgi:hypothetical protein
MFDDGSSQELTVVLLLSSHFLPSLFTKFPHLAQTHDTLS